jgi:hypothetical protein
MALISIAVLVYVVAGCVRTRRLTWDAQLCLAAGLAYWMDPLANSLQPIFLYNSNFTNLSNWCSHAPFVVNPDCGRVPEPVIFMGLVYAFGLPAIALVCGYLLRFVARHRPNISTTNLVVAAIAFGVVFDFAFEVPMIRFHLWQYPGFPNSFAIFSGPNRYPIALSVDAALAWGSIGAIRNLKNERGQTIVESGLEGLTPRWRTAASQFATIGLLQIILVLINLTLAVNGPYSGHWSGFSPDVINGVCDTAGFHGTRYGTCPGDPGYRIPIRQLPGPTPPKGVNELPIGVETGRG